MSLYKYLSAKYAEDLLYKGNIHLKSAKYFCSIEEDNIRGDRHDGAEIFLNNAFEVNGQPIIGKAFCMRSQEELNTTYIFCASKILNSYLYKNFCSDACVVIKNTDELKSRIINNKEFYIPVKKIFETTISKKRKEINLWFSCKTNWTFDSIVYFDDKKVHDVITMKAGIKQKFFSKRKSLYEWQKEYRCLLQLSISEMIFEKQADEEFFLFYMKDNGLNYFDFLPTAINFSIGNITDIAQIELASDHI